jgi:hypothetical protein
MSVELETWVRETYSAEDHDPAPTDTATEAFVACTTAGKYFGPITDTEIPTDIPGVGATPIDDVKALGALDALTPTGVPYLVNE